MYEWQDPSLAQRWTLAGIAGLWVVLEWWLLFGGGLARPGDPVRRACLGAALTIYYIRLLFTEFAFLKRGVRWSEVFTIAPWLLFLYLFLGIQGGRNFKTFGAVGMAGIVLFLVGSWLNSYAEYQRHGWKQRPENRGRLYTEGLFRYCRHPNYFGDVVSFSGLSMISGAPLTWLVPLVMMLGFVFANIPALDSYLHGKYGAVFDEYARKTRKLIPFVY